jgi:hypothetical protein
MVVHDRDHDLREYQRMETDKKLEEIFRRLWDLHEEVIALKVEFKFKSGIWGVVGGSIPVLITLLTGLFVYFVRS